MGSFEGTQQSSHTSNSPFTNDEGSPQWQGSFEIDLVGDIVNMIEFVESDLQTKIATSNEAAIPDAYRFIVSRMWETPTFASYRPVMKAIVTAFQIGDACRGFNDYQGNAEFADTKSLIGPNLGI